MTRIVVATGTKREASVLTGAGLTAIAGGGDANGLATRLRAAAEGAAGVLSFGMAGALADGVAIGDWIVANRLTGATAVACDAAWAAALADALAGARVGVVFADGRMIDTVTDKLALGARHGALAVDMESHVAGAVAAEFGLPFAVVRCVSDGARRTLPHAVTVAMRSDGGVDVRAVLASLARRPGQLPDLLRTATGFVRAMRALRRGAGRLGPDLALPA